MDTAQHVEHFTNLLMRGEPAPIDPPTELCQHNNKVVYRHVDYDFDGEALKAIYLRSKCQDCGCRFKVKLETEELIWTADLPSFED